MPRQGRRCRVSANERVCARIGSARPGSAQLVHSYEKSTANRRSGFLSVSGPGQWPRGTKAVLFAHVPSSLHSGGKHHRKKRVGGREVRGTEDGMERNGRDGGGRTHHIRIAIRARNDTWRGGHEPRGCPRKKSGVSTCTHTCVHGRQGRAPRRGK